MKLDTFNVWLLPDGLIQSWYVRQTAAQAIEAFRLEMSDIGWPCDDDQIICDPCGFVEHCPHGFIKTANYRGVPYARVGMRVLVGDREGYIVGNNSSANFNIIFPQEGGVVLNCHPCWKIKYYDNAGQLLGAFDEGVAA